MGAPKDTYSTSVQLRIVVPIGYDYGVELMKQQVILVTTANTWTLQTTEGDHTEHNWLSDVEVEDDPLWEVRFYNIEVSSAYLLTRDQAYAFERYGDRLARELASIVSKDVWNVQSRLRMIGSPGSNYRPRDF